MAPSNRALHRCGNFHADSSSIRSVFARQSSGLPLFFDPDGLPWRFTPFCLGRLISRRQHPILAHKIFTRHPLAQSSFYLMLFFLSLMEKSVKCQISNCLEEGAENIFGQAAGLC
jgi:hypothetical protein